MDINQAIENLIYYAKNNLFLGEEDAIYARNQLLELFKADYKFCLSDNADLQEEILDPMTAYAVEKKLTEDPLLFETKIMGLVTPSPGLVAHIFNEKFYEDSQDATKFLFALSVNSNYIRLKDIKKNIRWNTTGEFGNIGITINLAKPEKDPKQIQAEKMQKGDKYPKCPLCLENLGHPGSLIQPARQTLRYVPLHLGGEKWHLQYSPFVYYEEHCIAFADAHTPMQINDMTFIRLLDFVEEFPHYFMGSNADLPIVGGSILAHDHYQGGKKVLPMFQRPLRKSFDFGNGLAVGIVDWYNSVVKITSSNKSMAVDAATSFLESWRAYSAESHGIFAYTDQPHNTVTPIATMNEKGEFCLYLILRNNRTDEKHPYGIYHPTEDMHNIKKEGIGLIEAMGLFILPGRLKNEISLIMDILSKGTAPDFSALVEDEVLSKHIGMIAQLTQTYGYSMKRNEAQKVVIDYINTTCEKILGCTAVFKNTREGEATFDNFVIHTKKNYGFTS